MRCLTAFLCYLQRIFFTNYELPVADALVARLRDHVITVPSEDDRLEFHLTLLRPFGTLALHGSLVCSGTFHPNGSLLDVGTLVGNGSLT